MKSREHLNLHMINCLLFFHSFIFFLIQAATLKEDFNIDLRVMGITSSRTMLLSDV